MRHPKAPQIKKQRKGLQPGEHVTCLASDAISVGGLPIRVSAAVARRHLLDRAAERLGVPADPLTAESGTVSVRGKPSRSVSYGEIVAGETLDIPLTVSEVTASGPLVEIPGEIALKTPDQFRYIGTLVPRSDLQRRVVADDFCHKVRVPGMLHARMVFPDRPGAMLAEVDEASVSDVPGLVNVYRRGDLVAVICECEEQAINAMEQLRVTWCGSRPMAATVSACGSRSRAALRLALRRSGWRR